MNPIMNWAWIGSCVVAACSTVYTSAVHAGEPALPPRLQAQLQGILAASGTESATVLMVDALGVSGALQYGTNNCLPACAGPGPDALVALLAMRLTEQGKLNLHAPLQPADAVSKRCKTRLTLSHYLEHTSAPAGRCPGTQTGYRDADHKQSAAVLEKITHTSMTALMHRELFNPLGMTASQWKLPSPERTTANLPGHFLTTTPKDMAQLVQMMVQRGQIDGRTYLPPCAVERMGISVSAVSRPGGSTEQATAKAKYGLGLERFNAGGLSWLGLSGTLPGARWVWGYSSATKSGMVIQAPGANAATLAALASALAEHLRRDAVWSTQR